MRFGSLFSGIGGIDLGLERAGMTAAWQVENDDWCNQILAKHWPDVPRFGDITTVNTDDLEPVDVIAGGFPCQPVSLAGARKAQEDDRWLWPAYFGIVRALRPRYVLVENVPGLASAGMGDVLGDLAAIGYDCEWQSIPAAAVGAPHLRYRIFIVAYPSSYSQPERPVYEVKRQRIMVPDTDKQQHEGGSYAVGWSTTPTVLADTENDRVRRRVEQSQGSESTRYVADTDSQTRRTTRSTSETVYGPETVERSRRRSSLFGDHWAAEPDVGRVANGIPRRVDRLRGLGNAVVPQVAEYVGRRIMEHANQTVTV